MYYVLHVRVQLEPLWVMTFPLLGALAEIAYLDEIILHLRCEM